MTTPPSPPALRLAEMLHRRGAWAEAAEAYREALQAAPDHVGARHNLGVVLLRRGNLPEGLAQLRHAAKLAPGRAGIHLAIGKAEGALKRPGAAERAFREAIRLDPALAPARLELANLLVAAGRAPEAEAVLGAGLRRAPGDDDLEATLGLALSAQGRWAEAAATLSRVVERSPGHRAALRNLVQVENRLKRADRVVALAARYLDRYPDDAGIRSTYLMTNLYVSGDAGEMLRLARRWAAAAAVRREGSAREGRPTPTGPNPAARERATR